MESNSIQKFGKLFGIVIQKEYTEFPKLKDFIRQLQTSENWDEWIKNTDSSAVTTETELKKDLLFIIDSVIDVGNPLNNTSRNKTSKLLFLLSNRSETKNIKFKAFEFKELKQIQAGIELAELTNQLVVVSKTAILQRNTLFLTDQNFKILEIIDDRQEQDFIKKMEVNNTEESVFKRLFDLDDGKKNFKKPLKKLKKTDDYPNEEYFNEEGDCNEMNFTNLRQ